MRLHRPDVLLDSRLLAYRRGGISRYVEALLHWLPRVAPDLDIRPFINRHTELETTPVRVHTPPHKRFERTLLGLELSTRCPRLLHSPDFITPRVVGARRVVTVHDLNFVNHPEQLTPDSLRYYRQLESSLHSADRIIAVSSYTSGQLENVLHIDPSRIDVIPNGVELSERERSQNDGAVKSITAVGDMCARDIALDRPIVLMVGTIEPRKRHVLLLRALDVMRRESSLNDVMLVIAGQRGWMCDEIVCEIETASIGGDVIWLDDLRDDQLTSLYRAATVVAVPSLDEGFGLPVLEAMAAGAPVVAANRGALPEVAGDAAVLIDSDEPEDWATAIGSLVIDRQRRDELARVGIQRARQFTWEQTARSTASLYRELLQS